MCKQTHHIKKRSNGRDTTEQQEQAEYDPVGKDARQSIQSMCDFIQSCRLRAGISQRGDSTSGRGGSGVELSNGKLRALHNEAAADETGDDECCHE